MKVLLTNDDGIHATGLQSLRSALAEVDGIELVTIAPDSNRSAVGRGITTRRPLWVEEVKFDDGTIGYATDGTPVDCVRFAQMELVDGFYPDLIVSGINHGFNLGDDITYSGTVAAAFEGALLGIPAIAVSQQSMLREMDFTTGRKYDFTVSSFFTAELVRNFGNWHLRPNTLLNVNVPAVMPAGVKISTLGRRIFPEDLKLVEVEQRGDCKRYVLHGKFSKYHEDPGTDLVVVADGYISLTPVHFDLTDRESIDLITEDDFNRYLG